MSGPLSGVLAPLSLPLSWAYGGVVAFRNGRYDAGAPIAVGCPVISVGNITAGGVGKTPFVRRLVAMLIERGRRPAIAMRGYGARGGGQSDEEAEYAESLPDVPVVADPDRVTALGRFLPAHREIDCVILDDGFQHRRLRRDLDLVLVDASRPCLDDHLLPAGYLREPARGLRRADGVVVTRADAVDPRLAGRIAELHGAPPLAWSRHLWTSLRLFGPTAESAAADIGWLRGKRVEALLGVGNADAVVDQFASAGADVLRTVSARDHERYTTAKIERLREAASKADAVVMTGKDWVKARRLIDLENWPVPIVVPELTIDVFEGQQALIDRVLRSIDGWTPRQP